MRRWILPTIMTVVLVCGAAFASAQDVKMARGTVTAVTTQTLTIKVRGRTMTFAIDDKTEAVAEDGARRTAATQKTGAKPKVSDVIKVDQSVAVSYHAMPGMMHAAKVEIVSSKPK